MPGNRLGAEANTPGHGCGSPPERSCSGEGQAAPMSPTAPERWRARYFAPCTRRGAGPWTGEKSRKVFFTTRCASTPIMPHGALDLEGSLSCPTSPTQRPTATNALKVAAIHPLMLPMPPLGHQASMEQANCQNANPNNMAKSPAFC